AQAAKEAVATVEQPAAPAADQQQDGGFLAGLGGMLPMILIIVVMFYLMYRGQKKQQKQRQDMITAIKKGDKIVTVGGIYGTVAEVKEELFVITIGANTNIEIAKSAVGSVVPETTTIEAAQK
ncbi:MAG: preprotein translocase subunit YajC, partial [Lentisphaeria bacterium]|nr:preprotein translocase subunit YajC [Lentisphaeria bacterium]